MIKASNTDNAIKIYSDDIACDENLKNEIKLIEPQKAFARYCNHLRDTKHPDVVAATTEFKFNNKPRIVLMENSLF